MLEDGTGSGKAVRQKVSLSTTSTSRCRATIPRGSPHSASAAPASITS